MLKKDRKNKLGGQNIEVRCFRWSAHKKGDISRPDTNNMINLDWPYSTRHGGLV